MPKINIFKQNHCWLLRRVQHLNKRRCKFHFRKVIFVLFLVVILLQIIHMSQLSRLETKELERIPNKSSTKIFTDVYRNMIDRIRQSHKSDPSGTYHLIENILIGEWVAADAGNGGYGDVTLITQCSSNHLHHVRELCYRWSGPISLTIFSYNSDISTALKIILHVHVCNRHVRKWTTFHIVFPINYSPDIANLTSSDISQLSCDNVDIQTVNQINYAIPNISYPHNLLRNVAIQFSKTPYIFVVDIDMVPSAYLRNDFGVVIAKVLSLGNYSKHDMIAYVVPAFEIKGDIGVPSHKTELVELWAKGLARPFYEKVCWKCQKHTNYDLWRTWGQDLNEEPGKLQLAYTVAWKDPWEPFFITDKQSPLYDERFTQYGFNRISQVCEMHVAGFQFSVLSSAFLVHKGFKEEGQFHASKQRELDSNRLLFRKFKEELKIRYLESPRRCY